jgi:type IV pilus assembly protein PilC
MGYTLVKVHRSRRNIESSNKRIGRAEIVTFAYEFAGMYSAGLSITRCLETFEVQIENPAFKEIITDIRSHVETGLTLKDAFSKYRKVFSDFFVGMVEAGEAGGKLGETLQMAAVYLEKQDDLKKQVKAAFSYPIIVGIMCLLIVTGLMIFVIPVFQKLYSQLNVTLPGPTLLLIGISRMFREYWWFTLPMILLIVFIIRRISGNPHVKARLDSFKLNMPVFGKLNRMVVVSHFVRTFAMMSKAGVSVVESLDLARDVADNTEMDKIVKTIQEEIITGSSVAVPMGKFTIFPPMIVQMAAAGEEAGILPEMLSKGVDFLDTQIDMLIKSILVKIEPILSLIMGAVVGTILLGVYLPMFDYMGHIK